MPIFQAAPEKPAEEVVEEEVPPVEAPVAPEIGENFEVEYANGITHEIRDLGAALGKDVPPQVTYDIYKELLAERGPNGIIETPTYTMADGDIGIANPGASSWQDGVRQSILDKLAARGL